MSSTSRSWCWSRRRPERRLGQPLGRNRWSRRQTGLSARAPCAGSTSPWWHGWSLAGAGVVDGGGHPPANQLSDNVTAVGSALARTAQTFDTLSLLPLVGGRISQFVGQINDTAVKVERSGTDSTPAHREPERARGRGRGLIPTILMLVLYVPFRLSWRRYVAEVRRALAASPPDPLHRRVSRPPRRGEPLLRPLRALGGDPAAT